MATRIVRTGEPQDILAYLNGFQNDPLRYITDPSAPRQVIVENQKIFESKNLSVGQSFQLTAADKTYFCKVTAQSIWNPSLILVEGQQIHNVKSELSFRLNPSSSFMQSGLQCFDEYVEDGLSDKKTDSQDTKKEKDTIQPKNLPLQKAALKSLASNIITIISDIEPQDLGARPTRISPDDGTRIPDPTRNSDDGYHRTIYAEENIPLTEYWLNCAKKHNNAHKDNPVVAIMDTGIDFRYDWTMSHEKITEAPRGSFSGVLLPDCPLWFNESDTSISLGVPILHKDYIGWNCVGTGRLHSNQHPNPYDDDSANKHGTRIAAIIAQQTDWNVRLMILKTHDYRGVGLLFNIFCAFDYLLQRSEDVKIVNASWGYYGASNVRLQRYITDLEAKGIWFVNAAGNQTDFYDDYHGHELIPGTPTERYPACFSKSDNLVTTITTVRNRLRMKMAPPVSPSKNYTLQR